MVIDAYDEWNIINPFLFKEVLGVFWKKYTINTCNVEHSVLEGGENKKKISYLLLLRSSGLELSFMPNINMSDVLLFLLL